MRNDGHDDATALATEQLKKIRAELERQGVGRHAKVRRVEEKAQRKRVGDRRALRATGRDHLFGFRCREGLKEECMAAAKKAGMNLAEWMEMHLEAALASEATTEEARVGEAD